MTIPPMPITDGRAIDLARAALARPGAPDSALARRLIVVDVQRQRLTLLDPCVPPVHYAISTASAGVGGDEGSNRTPPGWHRIHDRIGAGATDGAVFVSREPTGEVWSGEPREEDLILTRILTLDGLESGVNRGPGRDSLARYIYIHGTNHPDQLGRPASHGCVRMANADVVDLFERVATGDPVLIVDSPAQRA